MLLEHVRDMSEGFGGASVKDCSIIVPNFWTHGQKISLITTAQAVGLNVLSLINENTAAALYYGIDRLDNETAQYVLFYNLGASYLQASLVKYDTAVANEKTIENIEILAQTYDATLGGSTFDAVLAEYLAKKFEEIHGFSLEKAPKAMPRLLTQANLAKKVLSASKTTLVIVNNLYNSIDFKYTLTREELDNLITPFEQRLISPITQALEIAKIDKKSVNYLEILGGVSRIPRVQEIIRRNTDFEISTHLNGDEAMAHGAALFAANLSSVVNVKPIWLSDTNMDRISVKIFELPEDNLVVEKQLFDETWKLASYVRVRVNSRKNLRILIEDTKEDKTQAIGIYETSGIPEITQDSFELVLMFVVDYNGISFLYKIDAEYMQILPPVAKKPKNISVQSEAKESTEENLESEPREKSAESQTETIDEPRFETKSFSIKFTYHDLEQPKILTSSDAEQIKLKLSSFKEGEKRARELAMAKNDIESYVYYLTDKADEEIFQQVASKSDRDLLLTHILLIKDWMDSSEFTKASITDVKYRKMQLEDLVNGPFLRENEMQIRDSIVEKARLELNKLESELIALNETRPWVPAESIEDCLKSVKELREWIDARIREQKSLELWQHLAFTTSELEKKSKDVAGAVERLKRMVKPKDKVSDI